MRGNDQQQGHVFSYISPEQRVRKDHPLRPIRTMVDKVLKELSPEFNKMYSKVGRPSIPPEQLWQVFRSGPVTVLCQAESTEENHHLLQK